MMKNNHMVDGNVLNSEGDDNVINTLIKRNNRPLISSPQKQKQDDHPTKQTASILGASGYVFQKPLGEASTSSTDKLNGLHKDQDFAELTDRASVSGRGESVDPTNHQAETQLSNSNINRDTTQNVSSQTSGQPDNSSDLVNTLPNNLDSIPTLASPLLKHAVNTHINTATLNKQNPLIQITKPHKLSSLPTTSLTEQKPFAQIKSAVFDPELAFKNNERLAARKMKKEDEARITQNRLAVQGFESQVAAEETAEIYHDLTEDLLENYMSSLSEPDIELSEEEIEQNMLKGKKNTQMTNLDSDLTQSHISHEQGHKNAHIISDKSQINKPEDIKLAGLELGTPNYLDIPAKHEVEVEKAVSVKI